MIFPTQHTTRDVLIVDRTAAEDRQPVAIVKYAFYYYLYTKRSWGSFSVHNYTNHLTVNDAARGLLPMLRAAEDHQQATRSLAEPEVINYCISNRKRRESPAIFLFLVMR